MSDVSHVVRTHHIDTGAIEMMCGERRDKWEDPDPGLPMCSGCAVELVNLLKHRIDDQGSTMERTRRIIMRELLGAESAVEEMTEELRALRKQVKKARKEQAEKVS
jgi:hypothetical protein